MQIRGLNLNSLVVFSFVYRSASMTLAAKELGMTQPGVTQHIKNLESVMNVNLFERVGKKLIPTKEAETFYQGLSENLESIENLLVAITKKDRQFSGSVRIGVPIEFGNTIILPKLSSIRQQFPQVQFYITYGLPHELNSLILEGKLDFAFMDHYASNPAIKREVVYHENLVLCCSRQYAELIGTTKKKERAFFESLSFVDYQPGEAILRDWFDRAYGFKKMKLQVASYCFDVQGIATLVKNSMGVGVLPEHVFSRMKDLHQFRPKLGAVNNPISLAYLEQRWNVPLNQFVITMLKDILSERPYNKV
ncbi:MAG: LysR family transcriptional regulator [Bacteriovoracaceae bacterium]